MSVLVSSPTVAFANEDASRTNRAAVRHGEPSRAAQDIELAVRFVTDETMSEIADDLAGRRFVVAHPTAAKGQLRYAIDDAVEGALAIRGALPPSVEIGASIERVIADQMLRVRALGTGLALVITMPRLRDIADESGALTAEDSVALLAWTRFRATQDIALVVLLRGADRTVGVQTPTPLETVLGACTTEALPSAELIVHDEVPHEAAAEAIPVTQRRPRLASRQKDRELAAERVVTAAEWRAFAVELDNARGPRPVSVIEKLFVTRYMPLVGAVARGETDEAVANVVDAWRQSFAHSYTEGFPAVRVTGKRPPMVFDAPDIANKVGRLNGSRAVKLLLVDSMGFALGERLMSRFEARTVGRAVCVDRVLLWSALPTTTPAQLALLARGPEGLRDPAASERDQDITRARALATLRRLRVGPRELFKLDLAEARLHGAGVAYEERLDGIADELSDILVKHATTLPPRTLLFIFGDHGFKLPSSSDGRTTGPASQGLASPEEVLVPGYAWLIGGVH